MKVDNKEFCFKPGIRIGRSVDYWRLQHKLGKFYTDCFFGLGRRPNDLMSRARELFKYKHR